MSLTPRLILLHKQSSSARTRFLRFPHGLVAFAALPAQASLRPADEAAVRAHPAAPIRAAEIELGLAPGSIEAVTDFHAEVDTPDGVVPVLLGGFTSIDPPFAAAERLGGKFIAITEARGLPAIDLDLARRAYEVVLG